MKVKLTLVGLYLSFLVVPLCGYSQNKTNDDVRLNDIQVIGSHNSYKIGIEKPLWDYLFQRDSSMAKSLQYEHVPLTEQLDLGLRNLELDVFHDPNGGYYSHPKGLDIVRSAAKKSLPFDGEKKLMQPGLKVFHVQDIDFRSHQLLFRDALEELLTWSNRNPNHTPIFITMNTKDGEISQLKNPLVFDAEALANLDQEIRSVLPISKLIIPDQVRGNQESLQQAILKNGWPSLNEVKGRILFVLDEGNARSDLYLEKFPGLRDAVLFVNKKAGNPEAAVLIINDPVRDFDRIKGLVSKGYLVRTRADSGTTEARNNDYARFEKAKTSGAQIITTDYYMPSKLFESTYQIDFGSGVFERIKK